MAEARAMTNIDGILPIRFESLLGLVLVAGWVGVDATALLQIMISQPLVAGWLGGLLVGEPALGLGVGLLLQLVWMRTLPLGGATLPLSGPAALVAGALAGGSPEGWRLGMVAFPHAIPLAAILVAAFIVAETGSVLTKRIRRRRHVLVERAVARAEEGDVRGVTRINLQGVWSEMGLGVSLVLAGLLVGWVLLRLGSEFSPTDPRWVVLPLVGLGLGQIVSLGGKRRWLVLWCLAALLIVGGRLVG